MVMSKRKYEIACLEYKIYLLKLLTYSYLMINRLFLNDNSLSEK